MNAEMRLKYFLFARPTFWTGAASIWDLGNTLFFFNDSPSGVVADYMAIKNDWVLVGDDLKGAVDEFNAPDEQLKLIPEEIGS